MRSPATSLLRPVFDAERTFLSGLADPEPERDIGRLALPLLVIDLETFDVRSLTVAAAQLIGAPGDSIVGRPVVELVPPNERRHVHESLAALRDGLMDFYRVRRRLGAPGSQDATTVWVRVVLSGGARVALSEISRSSDQRHSALDWYLGREPADLAVGTIDDGWTFLSVSTEIETILGTSAADLVGRSIRALVLDDRDVDRLRRAVSRADEGTSVALSITMRSRSGTTKDVWLVVGALAGSSIRGFIITEDLRHISTTVADRLSSLEHHMWNIAREVEATGITQFRPPGPDPSRFAQLRTLTTRQREILVRLTHGERVPTMAKALYISPSTVRNHLSVIFERFGVHSQPELLSLLTEEDMTST
ncbi:MAG: Response regulator containing a CheY-like receiver domain and an DNA-binding domain [Acidimicrobiales bacterium]|nr:Response regulator containing a CheY-like receiver domain and an DNA-binding domain [Acidimicrobiales bacterium]